MAFQSNDDFPYWRKTLPPPEAMFKALRDLDLEAIVSKTMPGGPSVAWVLERAYPADHRATGGISNHFTESARIEARFGKNSTPREAWSAVRLKSAGMTNEEQREEVYAATRECNLFSVELGRALYEYFGARGETVVDFSAGWGDRAIAAAAAGAAMYLGSDPNVRLLAGYRALESFLMEQAPDFRCELTCNMSITEDLPQGYAKVVLLSPPYFDLEIYAEPGSAEARGQSIEMPRVADQSGAARPDYESWLRTFLEPYYATAFSKVKPGGALVVYIENVRRPTTGEHVPLRDDTRKIIDRLPGAFPCGAFGLQVCAQVADDGWEKPKAKHAKGKQAKNTRKSRVRQAMAWIRDPAIPMVTITTAGGGGLAVVPRDVRCEVHTVKGSRGQRIKVVRPLYGLGMWGGMVIPNAANGLLLTTYCSDEDAATAAIAARHLNIPCHIVLFSVDRCGARRSLSEIFAYPWVAVAAGYGAKVTVEHTWREMTTRGSGLQRATGAFWVREGLSGSELTIAAAGFVDYAFADPTALGLTLDLSRRSPVHPPIPGAEAVAGGREPEVWMSNLPRDVAMVAAACKNRVHVATPSRGEVAPRHFRKKMKECGVGMERIEVHMPPKKFEQPFDMVFSQLESELGMAASGGGEAAAASPAAADKAPPFRINRMNDGFLWDLAMENAKDGDVVVLSGSG